MQTKRCLQYTEHTDKHQKPTVFCKYVAASDKRLVSVVTDLIAVESCSVSLAKYQCRVPTATGSCLRPNIAEAQRLC